MAGGVRRDADFTLVVSLSTGHTVEQAAEQAKVSARTVYRRLQDPAFRAAVDSAKAEAVSRATALLGALATGAVTTLGQLLKAESETARLGAARSILELGARLRESTELEARLTRLEERLAEQGGTLRRIR